MMKRIIYFMAALTTLTACAVSERKATKGAETVFTRHYRCADGREIIVEYDNSDPDSSRARVQLNTENPEKLDMKIAISASGARYTDGTLVWWVKGNTGTLREADDHGNILADECTEFTGQPVEIRGRGTP